MANKVEERIVSKKVEQPVEEISRIVSIVTEAIRDVKSFEDLYAVIDQLGEIQGRDNHVYRAEELKEFMDMVREHKLPAEYITRTGGLRSKVIELMKADKAE